MISNFLNNKILKLAPKYTVKDLAPDTFEKLIRNSVSGLVVYSGGSNNTIYGDAIVNYAFRAWHDSLHIKMNIPFTTQGERDVAIEQARIIDSTILGDIIMIEVALQAEYNEKTGLFIDNQLEFLKKNIILK